MNELQRLVVLTSTIKLLDKGVVIVRQVILSKVECDCLSKSANQLDLMRLVIQKFSFFLLLSRKIRKLSSADGVSPSDH